MSKMIDLNCTIEDRNDLEFFKSKVMEYLNSKYYIKSYSFEVETNEDKSFIRANTIFTTNKPFVSGYKNVFNKLDKLAKSII